MTVIPPRFSACKPAPTSPPQLPEASADADSLAALGRSAEWVAFFRDNADRPDGVPWELGAELTPLERQSVIDSVCDFQLGESSPGHNLLRLSAEHADSIGDPNYAEAVRLFNAEERRHSELLERFLRLADEPIRLRSGLDGAFRWLRRMLGLDTMISVLLTAEIIALVYYSSLRDATGSRVLRAICRRLLCDEVRHVRFQAERLWILRRDRSRAWRWMREGFQRVLMAGTLIAVWARHGGAFAAGGFRWSRYWQSAWRHFRRVMVSVRNPPTGPSGG